MIVRGPLIVSGFIALAGVLVLASGCDGIFESLEIPMPPTARETYEASGGNHINLHFLNPVNPVTVNPVYDGAVSVSFLLEGGCTFTYDLTASAGNEAAYWASQPMTLTYDADQIQCGTIIQSCDYEAIMIGSVADVSLVCHVAP